MPQTPTCFPPTCACNIIRFQLASVIPGTMSAICIIDAVPVGFGLADVPGALPPGVPGQSTVVVCDPQCAFFNEPPDSLVNRLGWAEYMQPLIPNTCQPYGYALEPQWEVFSLSCAVAANC